MPDFRRYGGYTAFIEGWALYAEAVMKEYLPVEGRIGSLQMRMMREARARRQARANHRHRGLEAAAETRAVDGGHRGERQPGQTLHEVVAALQQFSSIPIASPIASATVAMVLAVY